MPDKSILSPAVLDMVLAAATGKNILKGSRGALWSRLEGMAADLFPSGAGVFAAMFHGGGRTSAGAADGAAPPRSIGEAFWRASGASRVERRLQGRYYTPEPVIDRILDLVWDDVFPGGGLSESRALCDPALGCGFFLLRLAERLLRRGRDSAGAVREWAAERLYGVDTDPEAVFLARVLLWLTLSDAQGEFIPPARNFRCGDSLLGPAFGAGAGAEGGASAEGVPAGLVWHAAFPDIAAAGGFGAIVGNPPYEVLTGFARHPERRALAAALRGGGHYREALSGQVNLYRCFIERSLELLKPGGVLSMIVPLSLARDAAARGLRRRLILECGAGEWILFGENERIFSGVTQSACIFRGIKGGGEARSVSIRSEGETGEWTVEELRRFGGDGLSLPAVRGREAGLLRTMLEGVSGRFENAVTMHVGEVDQTVYRECMSDADTGTVLARGAHLQAFCLDVRPLPGRERFLRLARFMEMKGAGAARCAERAGERRIVQLGIRNMQSRPRLVAAVAPAGVYCGNSLNVYYPKRGLPLEYVAGLLNSAILDWLFRAVSGNNNINLHEMRGLPFPAEPEADCRDAVVAAYRRCEQLAQFEGGEGGRKADPEAEGRLAAARADLDRAAAACYGVPSGVVETLV